MLVSFEEFERYCVHKGQKEWSTCAIKSLVTTEILTAGIFILTRLLMKFIIILRVSDRRYDDKYLIYKMFEMVNQTESIIY